MGFLTNAAGKIGGKIGGKTGATIGGLVGGGVLGAFDARSNFKQRQKVKKLEKASKARKSTVLTSGATDRASTLT